ncbi:hypothetical protein N7471_010554 [Penicillium samsonianum]|uniref:uncharacterized protein n=1 Tax=Penicillium samsonianum TaxID=1882272 RepID=UPI0025482993|nr:uncharacterized protein N7471_010554 [Penicillium samsonianum]KAJ6126061.1 hypothetical protein N7471_010554 [Penicillium samsonianum]
MASVGPDSLHPDLAKKNPTTVQPIYFRIAYETLELVYLVEGGYLTKDKQLWIPSWGKVWEKIPTEQRESYDGAITKDGKWYAPKGEVDTTFATFTRSEALPPVPENYEEQRSWTVSYRAGQDDNWVFCPTSDWFSI